VFTPTKELRMEVAAVKFFTVKPKETDTEEEEDGDDNG